MYQTKWGLACPIHVIVGVSAHPRWQHLVAFRKAMNLLHWVMRTVLYRCTTTAIIKKGTFLINVLFAVTLAAARAIQSK
jgi:hypothetical protein